MYLFLSILRFLDKNSWIILLFFFQPLCFVCPYFFVIFNVFGLLEACVVSILPLNMILVQEIRLKIELNFKMSHYIVSMLYLSQVGCIPHQYAVSKTHKYAFLAEASSSPLVTACPNSICTAKCD